MEILLNKYFLFFFIVDLFNTCLREIFYPSTKEKIMLLLDSWTGHCERSVHEQKPEGKDIVLKSITKGTTSKIQPLDVYGFRVWKNYVRRFSDDVLLYEEDINLHLRNNIIKLQSLIHNQLSSSRYTNLFQYSWYKIGFVVLPIIRAKNNSCIICQIFFDVHIITAKFHSNRSAISA